MEIRFKDPGLFTPGMEYGTPMLGTEPEPTKKPFWSWPWKGHETGYSPGAAADSYEVGLRSAAGSVLQPWVLFSLGAMVNGCHTRK